MNYKPTVDFRRTTRRFVVCGGSPGRRLGSRIDD